jgi:flagellar M-ring protein FliF
VTRGPRLQRLSAAVLISQAPGGKPRTDAELRRLGELAKHALGFDPERGDRFDISSAAFAVEVDAEAQAAANLPLWERAPVKYGALGGLALLVIVAGLIFALKGRKRPSAVNLAMLKPGSKVAEVEAAIKRGELPPSSVTDVAGAGALDPVNVQARARELTEVDPNRAAHLLRAWIASDIETKENARV